VTSEVEKGSLKGSTDFEGPEMTRRPRNDQPARAFRQSVGRLLARDSRLVSDCSSCQPTRLSLMTGRCLLPSKGLTSSLSLSPHGPRTGTCGDAQEVSVLRATPHKTQSTGLGLARSLSENQALRVGFSGL
jgi:hypothetical protein